MSLLVSPYFAINGSVIAINGDSSAGTSNRQSDCFKNPTRRLARNVFEASRSSVDSNAHSSISTSRLCSTFAVNRHRSIAVISRFQRPFVDFHLPTMFHLRRQPSEFGADYMGCMAVISRFWRRNRFPSPANVSPSPSTVIEASRSSVDSNAHSSISISRLCSTFAVNRQNSARTILEAWLLSVERHVVVWTFGEMNLRCIAPHPHLTYANLGLI